MNRNILISHWITSILMLLLMAACSAPPSQPTPTPIPPTAMATLIPPTLEATASAGPILIVKFTEKDCSYDGPQSIPYGKFTVNWIVDDSKHNKTVLAIVTLAPGKALADLQACVCTEKPDWINALWLDDENAFGPELEKARSYIHEYDLPGQAAYHGEPLYMFCGNEEGKTVSLGPIAVTK